VKYATHPFKFIIHKCPTDHHAIVISTPALYFEGPRFMPWPGNWLLWQVLAPMQMVGLCLKITTPGLTSFQISLSIWPCIAEAVDLDQNCESAVILMFSAVQTKQTNKYASVFRVEE
jgi:hypothetical protein